MNIMKQEDKELLFKDLCVRLPYDVKVLYDNKVFNIDYVSSIYKEIKLDTCDKYTLNISDVKPYLFPFSSMTNEQLFEVQEILGKNEIEIKNEFLSIIDSDRNTISYSEILAILEWFNKNHFDYRGLIKKGLAIDATGLNIY